MPKKKPEPKDDFDVGPLIIDSADAEASVQEVAALDRPELSPWSPPIRDLVAGALAVLARAIPDLEVRWVAGWRVYMLKLTGPRARMFGYLAPLVDRVRLAVEHGGLVNDPDALFEPTTSRFHHREMRTPREVAPRGLEPLLRAAAEVDLPRRARTRPR
jgi:hypothetical protein